MSLSTNASTSSVSNATTNTVSFRANDGLDGTQSAWANFFQVMLGDDAFVDALVECTTSNDTLYSVSIHDAHEQSPGGKQVTLVTIGPLNQSVSHAVRTAYSPPRSLDRLAVLADAIAIGDSNFKLMYQKGYICRDCQYGSETMHGLLLKRLS